MYEKQQESTRHDHRALATGEHETLNASLVSLARAADTGATVCTRRHPCVCV